MLIVVDVRVDRLPNHGCGFLAELLAPFFIFFLVGFDFLLNTM